VVKHLKSEAKGCTYLVLWLDCDREGENICFEVISIVKDKLQPARRQQIYRAKFSSLTEVDLRRACKEENLGAPNRNESLAVDARQEIDLKVGVSFTRFQTAFFQEKYGNLDSRLISFGPCQTPTLGFCVTRHDEIEAFRPEPYYTVAVNLGSNPSVLAHHTKGKFKTEAGANAVKQRLENARRQGARVTNVQNSNGKVVRPQGLNTVQMLKLASTQMGISPQSAMHTAEHLYLSGYITYPRTETSAYAPSFDLREVVGLFRGHQMWGEYANGLLGGLMKTPKKGMNAGDHPPITPCKVANPNSFNSSQDWRLYELIARHFLASVSPDVKFCTRTVTFAIGEDSFTVTGSMTIEAGFMAITPWAASKGKDLPSFTQGETVPIGVVEIQTQYTSPPGYLTESELLGMMEANGIGTDASMPTHIENICERNYVRVEANSRTLVPTQLGIMLVHGYLKIDAELVRPAIRRDIEQRMSLISKGQTDYQVEMRNALQMYKAKFAYFRQNINLMDSLFETTFTHVSETSGKHLTRCGVCNRFMILINSRPVRLYCSICNATYKMPSNGSIKLYKELRCPSDNFELVLYMDDRTSYPFCPKCYNEPPFEEFKGALTCLNCPNTDCEHNWEKFEVTTCAQCQGPVFLNPNNKPKWRLTCGQCSISYIICEGASKITVLPDECTTCGSQRVNVVFTKNSPWQTNEMQGCLLCTPELSTLSELKGGKTGTTSTVRRGGGRRGRGGRGGRGGRSHRGRGRGKPRIDPKLTFDGF